MESLTVSPYAPYLGLAIFHAPNILVINPVQFRWGVTHGFEPMPPDIAKRVSTLNRRYFGFLMHALNIFFVTLLMIHVSVSPVAVGLSANRWKLFVIVGTGGGIAWLALQELGMHFVPSLRPKPNSDDLQEGAAILWMALILIGAFAEELWRAFCMIAFLRVGDSLTFAILITSFVFALGHYGRPLFQKLGMVPLGIAAALLFVASGSLAAPFAFHLVVNLGSLHRARRLRCG
jgi:membrane protease YdiL (CAAX protease family)